ncbi:RNA-directed DNA polymerase, eukaryota, Reverse transcriptase zinc-binding domain protein [Artemisia annua]|uniref:RNA-directed DNA polymerase, eukaryota, Reverse transcriptase zinc-binding domain protein n=1 Tax=Artemisia annua TaxID=35608 RepID=A0A2U1LKQ3_ARTAN|nr:RNA-directed DNA polymerase, eukaryota, Reverse transcriptase zinc-binding domain protein [Artemisia annua]
MLNAETSKKNAKFRPLANSESEDGFVSVTRKGGKGKSGARQTSKYIDGIRLNKSKTNHYYIPDIGLNPSNKGVVSSNGDSSDSDEMENVFYETSRFMEPKLAILSVLPFEEGKLSVKYLEVPLVSTLLDYRDCKELVEKVQNRIGDWKNKFLSFAATYEGFSGAKVTRVEEKLRVFWILFAFQKMKVF